MGFPQFRSGFTRIPFAATAVVLQNYTLTADSGTYAVTGTDATLRPAREINPDSGSYAVSGTDAGLRSGLSIPIAASSYALTGTSAGLFVGYKLAAASGSYNVTGTDATLPYVANPPISVVQIRRKNYPRAFHPSLRKPIRVAAGGVVNTYSLTASGGNYSLSGTDATLNYSQVTAAASLVKQLRKQDTWPRQFAPSNFGQLVSKRRAPIGLVVPITTRLAADGDVYALSGTSAATRAARYLSAGSGSYAVTGTNATLTKAFAANGGTYALTGTAASLEISHKLTADTGSYTTTGTSTNVYRSFTIHISAGSYALTGTDTEAVQTRTLAADSGSYAVNGSAVTFTTDATVPVGTVIEGNVTITTTLSQLVTITTALEGNVRI